MELNQKANEKFLRGDGITNEELYHLCDYYHQTMVMLDQLGPEFYLAAKECRMRYYSLDGFATARKQR